MNVPRLDIYVAEHCFGCQEAHRLASAVAVRFAALAVRVVDLEREPGERPEALVAVPSYLLDGQVIALGNPRQTDLFATLKQRLEAVRAPEHADDP